MASSTSSSSSSSSTMGCDIVDEKAHMLIDNKLATERYVAASLSSSSPSYSSSSSSAPSSSSSCSVFDCDEQLHVLAVDDSVVDRKLIEKLLITSACKVTTAENGKKALEHLGIAYEHPKHNDLKVNLIITDYSMPGMNGYELLKKIKESPTMRQIPVVIVSSENIQTRIKQCKEEGAQDFLLKPLKQEDVAKLICKIKRLNNPSKEKLCIEDESFIKELAVKED